MAAKKLKQSKATRKNKALFIRVTEAQKRLLTATAKKTGLSLSTWLLYVALRAAQAHRKHARS